MSSDPSWSAVDDYLNAALLAPDAVLSEALRANAAAGLPAIDVAPNQGKFLHLLARIQGARDILEIGTLGGYSTIWLARALPSDGRLLSLEAEQAHADVARANLARAGLGEKVEVRVGAALATLPQIEAEKRRPFDLVFIDADKPNNPSYFEWALKLTRPGSVIVIDNVVRAGSIVDPANPDPRVQGTRALFERLANEKRVSATAIQTVGSKGHDGFVLAYVAPAG
jgi:predicted O-methyltransferase YrrM